MRIGQEFSRNIREDVRRIEIDSSEVAGLPDGYIRAHAPGSNGTVAITTEYPDYVSFMISAKSSRARDHALSRLPQARPPGQSGRTRADACAQIRIGRAAWISQPG